MSDLADLVLTSPSGMTRAVARLRQEGLVEREHDPDDLRSFLVSLTPAGVRRLREAQVTHHAAVRELALRWPRGNDIERLAAIYERAMPGVLDAPHWRVPDEQEKRRHR